jgi:hypothetical protein
MACPYAREHEFASNGICRYCGAADPDHNTEVTL